MESGMMVDVFVALVLTLSYVAIAAYVYGVLRRTNISSIHDGDEYEDTPPFCEMGATLWPLVLVAAMCWYIVLRPFIRYVAVPLYRLGRHERPPRPPEVVAAEAELDAFLCGGVDR
jgi:hypothetical protein